MKKLKALKIWFVIHFAIDIIIAVPLMIMPVKLLSYFGWTTVDPLTARLVAAALFAIGIESLLSWKSTSNQFKSLLNLKIIWSGAAMLGILLTIIFNQAILGLIAWLIFIIFALFNLLWVYWRVRLK